MLRRAGKCATQLSLGVRLKTMKNTILISSIFALFISTDLFALTLEGTNSPEPNVEKWLAQLDINFRGCPLNQQLQTKSISSFLYNSVSPDRESKILENDYEVVACAAVQNSMLLDTEKIGKEGKVVILERNSASSTGFLAHYIILLADDEKVFERRFIGKGKGRYTITYRYSKLQLQPYIYVIRDIGGSSRRIVNYELYTVEDKTLRRVWNWKDYYEVYGGGYAISKIYFDWLDDGKIIVNTLAVGIVTGDLPILEKGKSYFDEEDLPIKKYSTDFYWGPKGIFEEVKE